jgi:hypothetical protein
MAALETMNTTAGKNSTVQACQPHENRFHEGRHRPRREPFGPLHNRTYKARWTSSLNTGDTGHHFENLQERDHRCYGLTMDQQALTANGA